MPAQRFITFEGGEGSGKSTQAGALADRLRALGYTVVTTREPGGSPFAERLREVLLAPDLGTTSALAQALTFYAARADHLAAVIVPALAQGAFVICDRFSDSTRVYQGVADGVAHDVLAQLEAMVVGTQGPDLTLVLDVPVAVGLERARVRRSREVADAFEARDRAFHEALRRGFQDLAAREPERCVTIAADAPADEVAAAVWATVADRYGLA